MTKHNYKQHAYYMIYLIRCVLQLSQEEKDHLDYYIFSGTYGNTENLVENQLEKSGGGFKAKIKVTVKPSAPHKKHPCSDLTSKQGLDHLSPLNFRTLSTYVIISLYSISALLSLTDIKKCRNALVFSNWYGSA